MLHFNNLSLKIFDKNQVSLDNSKENIVIDDDFGISSTTDNTNIVESIVDEIALGNIKALEKLDAMGIEYTLTKGPNGYTLSFQYKNNDYYITYVNKDAVNSENTEDEFGIEAADKNDSKNTNINKNNDTKINEDGTKEILTKDANGNIVKSEMFDVNGKLLQTSEFCYHKKTCQYSKTETITYQDGKKIINDYDKQERIVKQEVYNEKGELEKDTSFAYHEEDCPLYKTATSNYANGNKEIIDYDKQDRIVRQELYDSEGHKLSIKDNKYKEDGSYESTFVLYSYCSECQEEIIAYTVKDEYDNNSKLISSKSYDKDGKLELNQSFEYSENGDTKVTYKDSDDVTICTLEYNQDKTWQLLSDYAKDGSVERTIEVQIDNENNSKITTYKNELGNITSQIAENKDGKIETYYYENGNKEVIYSDTNEKVTNSELFNPEGKLIETIIYNENELVESIERIQYNNDNTISYTIINAEGEIIQRKKTDANAKILELSVFDELKNMWKTTEYKYQEDGSLYEKTTYENGELLNVTKKDKNGNIKMSVNYENGEIVDKTKYTYINDNFSVALVTDKNDLPIEVKTNYSTQVNELKQKYEGLLVQRTELVNKILEIRNTKDLTGFTLLNGVVEISNDIITGGKVTIKTKEELELYKQLEYLDNKEISQVKSKLNGLEISNEGYEILNNIAAKIQIIKEDACCCEASQKKFEKISKEYNKIFKLYNKTVKIFDHFTTMLDNLEFPVPPNVSDFCCEKAYNKALKKYEREMKKVEKEARRIEKSIQKVCEKLEDLKEKLSNINNDLMAL